MSSGSAELPAAWGFLCTFYLDYLPTGATQSFVAPRRLYGILAWKNPPLVPDFNRNILI